MRIYEKRGVWYLSEVGKDIKSFSSEQEARIAAGTKCEDCECDPCECATEELDGSEEEEESREEEASTDE
jgi:hypothetical protein